MDTEVSTHYVAHLKIEKVEVRDTRAEANKRDISEVTQMTIKGKSLETLTEKLGRHIAIVEEEED